MGVIRVTDNESNAAKEATLTETNGWESSGTVTKDGKGKVGVTHSEKGGAKRKLDIEAESGSNSETKKMKKSVSVNGHPLR